MLYEPPYTACPNFYREDPTPKAFGGGVLDNVFICVFYYFV